MINEYSDHLDIYLNNYDEDANTTLKTNVIKVYGATSEPTFTYKDRGVNQVESSVSGSWSDGVYTLTIKHNGPVDITINCFGNETDRLTSYKTSTLIEPEFPEFYTDIRQYEGEFFDYKNIEENVTNGCKSGITNYQGQGFIKFGTKSTASVKDTVNTTKSGTFNLSLRYSTTSDINNVDLYVNDFKVKTLSLEKGSSLSDWKTISQEINLKEGANKIELKTTSDLASTLYLDNFTVEGDFGDVTEKEIQPDENGYYFHDTFESVDFDWSARGSNTIGLSGRTPYMDDNALLVSERTASWNGAEKSLENLGFKSGNTYCFSACVEYLEGEPNEKFSLTLQYTDSNGTTQYSNIDTKTAVKGNYVQLYNPSYTIPEDATNMELVVETSLQTMNFYIDEVIGAVEGTIIDEIEVPSTNYNLGDVNLDGHINILDICALKNGLIYDFSNENSKLNADTNQDGKISGVDLLLLKKYVLGIIDSFE